MDAARGALVRALGLVERRGFRVVGVQADESGGVVETLLWLDDPTRSVDNLCDQLRKLVDVRACDTVPGGASPPMPPA